MISTDQVTDRNPHGHNEIPEQESPEQPYATLWLAGKEVHLFEDEDGEFFTA